MASTRKAAPGAGVAAPAASDATGSVPDSVLDDMLTPMERNVKTYLTDTLSKDLVELLAVLAVERPDDPHHWLAVKLLERSQGGPWVAVKKSALLASRKDAAKGAGGDGTPAA